MSVSFASLIGQLIPLLIMLALVIVGIRFLLGATRLMNRKADQLEQQLAQDRLASRRRD